MSSGVTSGRSSRERFPNNLAPQFTTQLLCWRRGQPSAKGSEYWSRVHGQLWCYVGEVIAERFSNNRVCSPPVSSGVTSGRSSFKGSNNLAESSTNGSGVKAGGHRGKVLNNWSRTTGELWCWCRGGHRGKVLNNWSCVRDELLTACRRSIAEARLRTIGSRVPLRELCQLCREHGEFTRGKVLNNWFRVHFGELLRHALATITGVRITVDSATQPWRYARESTESSSFERSRLIGLAVHGELWRYAGEQSSLRDGPIGPAVHRRALEHAAGGGHHESGRQFGS